MPAEVRRKKTIYYAAAFLKQQPLSMGGDNFFELLRRNKLLVRKTK